MSEGALHLKAGLRRLAGPLGLVLTLAAALAVAVAILATWERPGEALQAFFLGPFSSVFA